MLVVSDIEDPFLPTVEGIFVNPQESRYVAYVNQFIFRSVLILNRLERK